MNPSRKLPEVFVLIIPQAIQIHFSRHRWEVIVLVVCSPSLRRVLRRLGGVRIFVLIIIPKMVQIQFGEWEVVVVCRPRRAPRRGVKILQYSTRPWKWP